MYNELCRLSEERMSRMSERARGYGRRERAGEGAGIFRNRFEPVQACTNLIPFVVKNLFRVVLVLPVTPAYSIPGYPYIPGQTRPPAHQSTLRVPFIALASPHWPVSPVRFAVHE